MSSPYYPSPLAKGNESIRISQISLKNPFRYELTARNLSFVAEKDLGKIRQVAHSAIIVRGTSSYYIIESKEPLNLAAATSAAYKLKNELKRRGFTASVSLIPLSK